MADSRISTGTPVGQRQPKGVRKLDAAPAIERPSTMVESEDDDEEQIPLIEDDEPQETPVYTITPIQWHPDRVRMWLALGSFTLVGFTYIGLFVLVLTGASDHYIAFWSTSISGASALAGAAVTYFFTKRERVPPRRR